MTDNCEIRFNKGKTIKIPNNIGKAIFDMSERLATEHYIKSIKFDTAKNSQILGEIYLMGFMHAYQAMNKE